MNNEETQILNPQQPDQPKTEMNNSVSLASKKANNKASLAAGVLAGGMVGGAAAAAAMGAFSEEEGQVEQQQTAPVSEPTVQYQQAQHQQSHHANHHSHPSAHQDPVHVAPVVEDNPDDLIATVDDAEVKEEIEVVAVGDETNTADDNLITASNVEDVDSPDSDVHVIGVDIVDDGEGGQMFVAGLEDQATGEQAIVVDVDMDGTIDVLAVDLNQNQSIEQDEILDVSAEGWQDEDYIDAYVQEQQAVEEQMYVADDTPDYMNDAVPALYEA